MNLPESIKKALIEQLKKQGGKPDKSPAMMAKANAAESMSEALKGMMLGDIKGMSKVTIAAKNPKDLKEGLEKAEEVVESIPEISDKDKKSEEDLAAALGEESEDSEESEELSEEQKIAELEKQIAELKAKKFKA